MGSSYPNLHASTLLDASEPFFARPPSKGIEGMIQHMPQVPWESHNDHLCRHLGKVTKAYCSYSASKGVQSIVATYG